MWREGQLAMADKSEAPRTLSVSGTAPVAVTAPSAPVSVSVSWARSSIPWARPVAAVEVKKVFHCITTLQQISDRGYSCTLSSGGHRALSSVHERLASGAWSYRTLHEYTLCWNPPPKNRIWGGQRTASILQMFIRWAIDLYRAEGPSLSPTRTGLCY